MADGAILPEPNLPESERWKTSQGKNYYPYVRILGGVSLFDFDNFDADSYSGKFSRSSWYEFVPWRDDWGSSVWIEIQREHVQPATFISGQNLLAKWKAEEDHNHTIMPYIEAAFLGALPVRAFGRAFLASAKGQTPLLLR